MTSYLPIQGTHGTYGDGPQWWRPESDLAKFLLAHELKILKPEDPFIWSTDINGLGFLTKMFGSNRKHHNDWVAGGAALRYYLDRPCKKCAWPQEMIKDRNLIAHSHGLQVVLYACAQGLRVRRLISVGSPIRADMFGGPDSIAKRALPNIDAWLHIHDTTNMDIMQRLGEVGDGKIEWRGERKVPIGTVKDDGIAGIGHSGVLCDPRFFGLWESHGWINFLKV
jgi:hypothetical protein